jgi:hypothetical protein
MTVARLRLAPAEETMFPPRAPFFERHVSRAVHAGARDHLRGHLPVDASGVSSSPRTNAGSFAAAFVLGFEVPPGPLPAPGLGAGP